MWRRKFIAGLAGTVVFPLTIRAQTPRLSYRLGHLSHSSDSEALTRQIILPELARLGFVDGRNLIFDARVGDLDALPGLMRELLAARPDAIAAIGPGTALAGTATRVPIVVLGSELVELGLATSHAQPRGNVTGVVILARELNAKRLSLLVEAVPDRRRVAALIPQAGSGVVDVELRKSAAELGVELLVFAVATPGDYLAAFQAMRMQGAQALVIAAAPQFQRDGRQLAGLAREARLPTVCEWAEMAHAGCLLGYGPNRTALRKRMADQIAQIFRGVAPGNIPIERPTIFELAMNLKVAKALDLIIPSAVLARADEVIE